EPGGSVRRAFRHLWRRRCVRAVGCGGLHPPVRASGACTCAEGPGSREAGGEGREPRGIERCWPRACGGGGRGVGGPGGGWVRQGLGGRRTTDVRTGRGSGTRD